MVRRHGRRSVDPDAPVVDLDRVLADDVEIDRIARRSWPDGDAAGSPPRTGGAHRAAGRRHRQTPDEQLFELLDDWRLELADRPMPDIVLPRPTEPARTARARHRRRSWHPAVAVAAAIGAVLVGSATVGAADAGPASPLWPITQAIWPDRAQSIESARQIQIALDEARVALNAGRSHDAMRAIGRAEAELVNIDDEVARDSIREAVDKLWAQSEPSVPSRPIVIVPVPFGAAAQVSDPGSAPGSTEVPAPDLIGSSPDGPLDGNSSAVVALDGPSGSSIGPPVGASVTTAATIASAAPVPADPAPSTAPAAPATPATVPDPSVVAQPVGSGATTSSSPPPVATQQSGPTPTQTTESPTDAGVPPTPRGAYGLESGDAQSSAAADQAQLSSTTGGAPSG